MFWLYSCPTFPRFTLPPYLSNLVYFSFNSFKTYSWNSKLFLKVWSSIVELFTYPWLGIELCAHLSLHIGILCDLRLDSFYAWYLNHCGLYFQLSCWISKIFPCSHSLPMTPRLFCAFFHNDLWALGEWGAVHLFHLGNSHSSFSYSLWPVVGSLLIDLLQIGISFIMIEEHTYLWI